MREVKHNPRFAELTGKAGEFAVACQLALRGMNVFFPAVDNGVDLLAENGCRIQVKTAHLRCTQGILKLYPEGVYSFHFPRHRHLATSKTDVRTTARRPLSETCDVVVLYGIEQNRFWVIPSALLADTQAVFMGPKNAREFEGDIKQMQEMVTLGYSQAEIGKHYGIRQSSVGRRLQKAGTETFANSTAVSVRACENAWEHITEFGKAMDAVNVPGPAYHDSEGD